MPADETFWVTLPGKSDWKVETAANAIPASLWPLYSQPELCQQQMYVFRQGNRNYVLPVIELARALLIRNKPIARQLFMPAGLNQLAPVNQHRPFQGQAEIKFREETPLYLIDNPQVLYHLIWLLLHPEPSRLFSSVYRHMVEQQESRVSQTYRRFTFIMDIPDLPGMKVEYAGPIWGNTVFVREVLGFTRLPDHGYKPLFSHPARKQPVKNGGVQASASPVFTGYT
ncbi:hypothetical protein [Endozoicomonas sp. ALB091]|uniref:hypothetical protein n=1 Tax=Endozoicomonas sp. ALB091 TaxID=3403073 RepID=UPI003BB577A9